VVIPFYAASVVETVQSDIASEKPGIFDVFQEGISRFLSWSAPQTGELKMHLKYILFTLTFSPSFQAVYFLFGSSSVQQFYVERSTTSLQS